MKLLKKIINLGKTSSKGGSASTGSNGSSSRSSRGSNGSAFHNILSLTSETSGTPCGSASEASLQSSSQTEASDSLPVRRSHNTTDKKKIGRVREYFRRLNAHDLEAAKALLSDDVMWYFYDKEGYLVHEMRWDDFADEVPKVFASFPDFAFRRHTIDAAVDGTVHLSNGCASGTHTGDPFGFGPFEPIEASGKFVQNDPEDAKISFRDGKIFRFDVYAKGEMTGPPGIYTQLGGFPLM